MVGDFVEESALVLGVLQHSGLGLFPDEIDLPFGHPFESSRLPFPTEPTGRPERLQLFVQTVHQQSVEHSEQLEFQLRLENSPRQLIIINNYLQILLNLFKYLHFNHFLVFLLLYFQNFFPILQVNQVQVHYIQTLQTT